MESEQRKNINQRQQEFYNTKKKNLPTKIWSYFRNGLLNQIRKDIRVEEDIYKLHKEWFGDLSRKKVLDLGCYAGNSLSYYLAQNSKEYLGIDLSSKGIEDLSGRLQNLPRAKAIVMDFLSDDFKEKDFDLIYAYGVLHHFKDVDELILKLQEKLNNEGLIVSYDPLKTSLPIKFIRAFYRPFQSDKDWEWPFSRKTYYKFKHSFDLKDRRAVLGKAKWSPILTLIPISKTKKKEKLKSWYMEDWHRSAVDDKYMFGCMHLSMLLQKKE